MFSNILKLIKWTKCDQKTYFNFNHNYLIILNQKYFILFANDFCKWNKAIEINKVILYLSLLNIKNSLIKNKKSQIFITNNNTIFFNDNFSSFYSFSSLSYSFSSLFYSFIKEYSIFEYSFYRSLSSFVLWELIIILIEVYLYFQSFIFSFIINSFKNISYLNFYLIK